MELKMIIISPYSRKLRNGNENAKNYPQLWWKELIARLSPSQEIVQIGVKGEEQIAKGFYYNQPLDEIKKLLENCKFWMSPDNFLPHLANIVGKRGVVLWGPSDPLIFGYPQNVNILKDRSVLRKDQFGIWEDCPYDKERFVPPEDVIKILRERRLI
jgi:ADP-heptose:LPS heptosyltransferase